MNEELLAEIKNSIRKTVNDTKIAVAFSGGVDSTLLAKILHDMEYDVHLLTIGFHDSHDIIFAKEVNKILGYSHNILEITHETFKEVSLKIHNTINTDNLSWNENSIAFYYVSKLAKQYDALVHVDDSHATGFIGNTGRGSIEYHGVVDNVDIITSTFGKALGGASGGFTSSSKNIIDMLRQRSRPYLFSNSLAPSIVSASIAAITLIENDKSLLDDVKNNTTYFRKNIVSIGYNIKDGDHPIVPIMLGDAKLAQKLSKLMLQKGIYVIGFSFPVVPKNEARIRVQISAGHSKNQIDQAIDAFKECGKSLNII